ncbi:MAG: hypothetical protein A2293_16015 [Elusimicrobia bacterium RIFOXYB2_FULL_49_7]|nr:MAG: hypothetical protein A2293_16015 [Elusimicrobia bacterium RIFOXYB2_FULL_49_7]
MEKDFIKTPAARKQYEREARRLMIAHQIVELRQKRHMSQAKLAKLLHTKQQAVARMEKTDYRPSLNTLEKVAEVFGKKLEVKFV